jgi:hypothetical protein
MTEKTDKCNCVNYRPLELSRDQISKRIKESEEILKTMEPQAETSDRVVLYRCRSCGRFWQKNVAWNWGGKEYLFQIPETTPSDWLNEQFMSPAEMLIYSALTSDYFKANKFVESKRTCQKEECDRMALENNVLCGHHFIESLQRVGLLPREPKGKIFEPYSK